MNKETSTIPYGVISTPKAEKLLGINVKQKKEYSQETSIVSLNYEPVINYRTETTDTQTLTQRAILDAITTPYLRGVIAFFFSNSDTTVHMSHLKQSPVKKSELLGILITCYREMTRHLNQKFTVTFKENKQTHMIEGNSFASFLTEKFTELKATEVLIVNIHHDYIKCYANVGREDVLLDLLRMINDTPHEEFVGKKNIISF